MIWYCQDGTRIADGTFTTAEACLLFRPLSCTPKGTTRMALRKQIGSASKSEERRLVRSWNQSRTGTINIDVRKHRPECISWACYTAY